MDTIPQNTQLAARHLSMMHMRASQDHFKAAIACMLRGLDGDTEAAAEIKIARGYLRKAEIALDPERMMM